MSAGQLVDVDGRTVKITSPDRVLFPATGFTKADLIQYYADVAPVLIPHLDGRALTVKRWPDGVDKEPFFAKNAPSGTPDWVTTVDVETSDGHNTHVVVDHPATLVWLANLSAIELHAPMRRVARGTDADAVVFDLDPGDGAGMAECIDVAHIVRELLAQIELEALVKVSGGKGLHLYVPVTPTPAETTHTFAHTFARVAESQNKNLVVTNMKKAERTGKVLIDWSQNHYKKTTVAPYSVRGRETPTVSTPVTWDELDAAAAAGAPAEHLTFHPDDVRTRLTEHGDLFADAAKPSPQTLPTPRS